MGLLDFFACKPVSVNPFVFYPENIYQDPSKSITKDGKYDLTRFSSHEEEVVRRVMQISSTKYEKEFRAIGLANEAYPIVYKPRYVLFEMLILQYADSSKPLEQIAVAFAYANKDARFRSAAIDFFESAVDLVDWKFINQFSSLCCLSFFCKFSQLYEQEHQYEKAIRWNAEASKYCKNNPHYSQREKDLKELAKKPKQRRKRNATEEQVRFDNDVRAAATLFLNKYPQWSR